MSASTVSKALNNAEDVSIQTAKRIRAAASETVTDAMNLAMLRYMPLRTMLSIAGDKADPAALEELIRKLNER